MSLGMVCYAAIGNWYIHLFMPKRAPKYDKIWQKRNRNWLYGELKATCHTFLHKRYFSNKRKGISKWTKYLESTFKYTRMNQRQDKLDILLNKYIQNKCIVHDKGNAVWRSLKNLQASHSKLIFGQKGNLKDLEGKNVENFT